MNLLGAMNQGKMVLLYKTLTYATNGIGPTNTPYHKSLPLLWDNILICTIYVAVARQTIGNKI